MRAITQNRRLRVAGAAVAAALAGIATLVATGSGSDAAPPSAAASGPTATLTVQNLVQTDDQPGTLGYGTSRTVYSQLGGTVTWLPAAGDVIRPDHRLLSLDGSPVVLMDGSFPMYRSLSEAVTDGPDVRELNADLIADGYDPYHEIAQGDDFTAGTADAVDRWERAHGLTEDGEVALGRMVFLPGRQRIATVNLSIGQTLPAGPVAAITTTSDRHVVTVQLDASKQTEAVVGERVAVTLPSNQVVRGVITDVGRVAQTSVPAGGSSSGQGGSSSGQESGGNSTSGAGAAPQATVPVTIQLRDPGRLPPLDQAPVTVAFALTTTRDALSIPVSALLATAGGSYAVDVVRPGGSFTRVAVTPGSFAGGYVQISGPGIEAGMQVRDTAGT